MEVINNAFHLVSLLLALLAAILLVWVNQERKHSNRLLAFVLFGLAMQNLMLILLFTRLILEVPLLLRVFAPTTFLIAPAAYIYIRSLINDELRFKKYDWLFLVPAALVVINFIPYYLLSAEEKIAILNENFYNTTRVPNQGRGILPNSIFYALRIIWSAVCLFMGFRLIYLFRKKIHPSS
jgi:hypothetical protein